MNVYEKSFVNLKKNQRILIVCNDAGGAEVVLAWVKHNPSFRYSFILDGPAVVVFERVIGGTKLELQGSLASLIEASDFVLTGSGWMSSLEKKAVKESKERGVRVATYIDHWVNYQERFQHDDGSCLLPDEIWVADKHALNIAEEVFCDASIKLVENPYLKGIKDEFVQLNFEKNKAKDDHIHILYVCEPISSHHATKRSLAYSEFEAMNLFISQLEGLAELFGCLDVKIRRHPSEFTGKYSRYVSKSKSIQLTLSEGNTLLEDCVWSDWVVGMNSMALVVALTVGKKVFCCIPDSSESNVLPFEEIQDFCALRDI